MSEVMYFHNENLDIGDRVKVYFDNGYYVGRVVSRYEWFAQDKVFCTVKVERMVKDGLIMPSDKDELVRIPSWQGIIKKIA